MKNSDEILEICIRSEERLKTIFNRVNRIEGHLSTLNGKVAEHEKFKIQIKSYWIVISVLTPLLITLFINFM
jgi:hypothetical protein|tara:strand:+ start:485 stop:700 length:216 start_codon:yes stop_codon:yes gene_type:complete